MCIPHVFLVSDKVRGECQIIWDWKLQRCVTTVCVLGTEPRSSIRAASALTAELILQPHFFFFLLASVIPYFFYWLFIYISYVVPLPSLPLQNPHPLPPPLQPHFLKHLIALFLAFYIDHSTCHVPGKEEV